MQQYTLKRLLLTIPTVLGAVTLVFFAMQLAPGDPASLFIPPDLPPAQTEELVRQINAKYGFDDPIHVQYLNYLRKLAQLDLGESLRENRSIVDDLERRIPHTLQLGLAALALSAVIGITVGVVSAVYRGSWLDRLRRHRRMSWRFAGQSH